MKSCLFAHIFASFSANERSFVMEEEKERKKILKYRKQKTSAFPTFYFGLPTLSEPYTRMSLAKMTSKAKMFVSGTK